MIRIGITALVYTGSHGQTSQEFCVSMRLESSGMMPPLLLWPSRVFATASDDLFVCMHDVYVGLVHMCVFEVLKSN